MATYISMLRGINVNGQNRLKMESLKRLYEIMGFTDVRTYVQSGNVIFNVSKKPNILRLSKSIEENIRRNFGLTVSVFIRTPNDFKEMIENNPFLTKSGWDLSKLHVTFLSDTPKHPVNVGEIGSDLFHISGKDIYLYCPNGYGRTKLSNSYFEKILSVTATTRSWNSVNKLYEIAANKG